MLYSEEHKPFERLKKILSGSKDILLCVQARQLQFSIMVCKWQDFHSISKQYECLLSSLAEGSTLYPEKIKSVELLGYGKVKFTRTANALVVSLPEKLNNIMPVLKIKK